MEVTPERISYIAVLVSICFLSPCMCLTHIPSAIIFLMEGRHADVSVLTVHAVMVSPRPKCFINTSWNYSTTKDGRWKLWPGGPGERCLLARILSDIVLLFRQLSQQDLVCHPEWAAAPAQTRTTTTSSLRPPSIPPTTRRVICCTTFVFFVYVYCPISVSVDCGALYGVVYSNAMWFLYFLVKIQEDYT